MFENVYSSQFFLGKYVITFDYLTDKKRGGNGKKVSDNITKNKQFIIDWYKMVLHEIMPFITHSSSL